jgi:transcription elongation factor GreA
VTNEVADDISLGEAAKNFLASLTAEERAASQTDINRFVRWFGSQRPIAGLNAPEIENYSERLSQSDKDYSRRLEVVKAFLAGAKKFKWTKSNLGTNLKPRKTRSKTRATSSRPAPAEVILTQEGHSQLVEELDGLKARRLQVTEDIRKAAADKDFRENAPLHAAREEKGHIEGRIMELEATLKAARIMDMAKEISIHVSIGKTVVVCDLSTGEEARYTLVSPREVDLVRGKISSVSPIGQALLGKREGQTCNVTAPVGTLRYKIKRVE